MPLDKRLPLVITTVHSRFPVIGEKNDEVLGILHAKDLLRYQNIDNEAFDLHDIVVDEYGEVLGFVTLEDIIEQIIGDIEDEFDIDEEANIKTHANGHYIIKSHTPIKEFNIELHAQFNDKFYDTIGGIIMANFGYLPKPGETIEIDNFEVTLR